MGCHRRYLEYKGYKFFHVQNFTDVDDKICWAAEEGDPGRNCRKYIAEYLMIWMPWGSTGPFYPRVTEHISDIIEMVQGLIEKGYAYEVDGDVYFAVERFDEYGKLSGRSLDEMRAGARVEVDEKKANPMDFALWKRAKPGEIAWESPWGKGRPGWHIECSVMSHKYLGDTFDFHGGGVDLVFPHHENEIAQSEAYTGQPFVRYWLHNGFVNFSGEKMAKSVGNVITIREARQEYAGLALRLFLLSTHYRSPIDFDLEKLAAAQKGWERIQNAWEGLEQALDKGEELSQEGELPSGPVSCRTGPRRPWPNLSRPWTMIYTALAVGVLFDLIREINSFLREPVTTAGKGLPWPGPGRPSRIWARSWACCRRRKRLPTTAWWRSCCSSLSTCARKRGRGRTLPWPTASGIG